MSDRYPRRSRGRLSRAELAGRGAALFTICLLPPGQGFVAREVVAVFAATLAEVVPRHGCRVPAYCFMPWHLHLYMEGLHEEADTWLAVVHLKRITGAWLEDHRGVGRWQAGFDVRVKNAHRNTREAVAYVVNNPVRAGLVEDWRDHPFTGSVDEAGQLGPPVL